MKSNTQTTLHLRKLTESATGSAQGTLDPRKLGLGMPEAWVPGWCLAFPWCAYHHQPGSSCPAMGSWLTGLARTKACSQPGHGRATPRTYLYRSGAASGRFPGLAVVVPWFGA